jgi:ABC-type phosphate transport system substrate-binding protein
MNRRNLFFLLVILLQFVSLFANAAPGADIAVVANKDVPVDNLTFAELRKILLGDRQFWSSSVRVTLLIHAPVARERDVVLKNVLEMSEAQFRQYWIGKVFRAESSVAPKTVDTNERAAALVSNIPGAVAFMDAEQVPKTAKVIKIDGLSPGQKGYPLH